MDNLFDADWNNNPFCLLMRYDVTIEQVMTWYREKTLWETRGETPIEPKKEYAEDCF